MVGRLFRITLVVSLGLLLLFAGGALAFWKALHQVPRFYQEALLLTPAPGKQTDNVIASQTGTPSGGDQQKESGWNALVARAEALASRRQPQTLSAAASEKADDLVPPPESPQAGAALRGVDANVLVARAGAATTDRQSQAAPRALPAETGDKTPASDTDAGGTPDQDGGLNGLFGRVETLATRDQPQGRATTPPRKAGDGGGPSRLGPADDVGLEARWNALFTAAEINHWLALNMRKHLADVAHGSLSDLRVAIEPHGVAVGCRLQRGKVNTVLSLSGVAELAGDQVIAVRIRQARAGAVPLRMDEVMESISEAASCCGLQVRWRQSRGDPVALITVPLPQAKAAGPVRLDTLRLGRGEAWLSGSNRQL